MILPVPPTRRGDVVDILHGDTIADPYRWLEDTDSAETAEWVAAQNGVTSAYLNDLPDREAIRRRLAELWDVTRHGVPVERGGRWFFTRHDGLTNQPVLLVADEPGDDGRVLLDPNTMSADGTVALTGWSASRDGTLLAYGTSSAGSDWVTWRVREVDGGTDRDDVIEWSKWSVAAWLPDGSGFFYGALDPPKAGEEYLGANESLRIQLHLLGAPDGNDRVVYVDPDPQWIPEAQVVDGRWLVVTTWKGTDTNSVIRVLDLADVDAGFRMLVPDPIADTTVVGSDGSTFFALTNHEAPRRRVVAIDLDRPDPSAWREIVPESGDALLSVVYAGGELVCHLLHDASSRLQSWSPAGALVGDADLPDFVSVTELRGEVDQPTVYLGITSFTDPGSVWSCEASTGRTRQVRAADLPIDISGIVVSRAQTTSADGTTVPMFLVHRRDVAATGDVPAMLYGYGGFDIAITPTFNAARLVWVERGGLLAVANLRGGGEFGKEWRDAGRLERKQNVFEDVAACARWLASSGWSRPDRIVANGGSNGGLLVGALLTQHPELIGAAVPEVGVLDLLRFHKFTIGWAWTSDYGDPDDPAEYPWTRAYSPLHAIVPGTSYPSTLVMTGDHDDRVVPGHSFKFAAALQAAQGGPDPVLIRIETAAGHGLGKPVTKVIEERADMLAFCQAALSQ